MTNKHFQMWVQSVIDSNNIMHENEDRIIPNGMTVIPSMIKPFDHHASILLERARTAHDELVNYLRSCLDEHNPIGSENYRGL